MSQLDPSKGLNCQKLAQDVSMDNHVYTSSVRPTKSKTTYRGGIAYLCLGIIGVGYSLLLLKYPPVWDYVFVEIFHAVIYSFAGMLLIVCSSNFDKRRYMITGVVVGSCSSIMCIIGAIVAGLGAGYSQSTCECTTELHGSKLNNLVIDDYTCKLCGSLSHLLLYLAILVHCCLQFGVAIWISLHSGKRMRYHQDHYRQQIRVP